MAHIKNHDTVKLYFINLAKCVFFIPSGFVDKFTRDSEILCDNRVMGAADIGKDTYGDMLLKECSAEHSIIKGLAFSDSFLSLQSRIDALYKFSPENRQLTVFAVAVIIVLFTSFVSDCLTFDNLTLGDSLPKVDVLISTYDNLSESTPLSLLTLHSTASLNFQARAL